MKMNEKDNRWLRIWATERNHGKSIPDSKTDAILQFMYLEDVIKEEPYTFQKGCYKPNTIRIASSPSVSTETSITVVIKGFVEDPRNTKNLHILRDIYVRLESKKAENVGDWQFCIASLFSFLFSCRIFSGMRFNMLDEWKGTQRIYPPYVRTGTPEEIERASRDYPLYYKLLTPIISDVILSWTNYYFSHRAFSLGIHKYLGNVNHESKMPVDLTIATICEAFEQCSNTGNKPEKSMKEWSNELTKTIRSIDEYCLSKIRNDALQFYQNSKHFQVGSNWDREAISNEKVVAQSFFMRRFFQLKILYIVLKDNLDVFHKLYPYLVEDANNVIKQAYGSELFT